MYIMCHGGFKLDHFVFVVFNLVFFVSLCIKLLSREVQCELLKTQSFQSRVCRVYYLCTRAPCVTGRDRYLVLVLCESCAIIVFGIQFGLI